MTYDVIVVGGGLVGLAMAAALERGGIKIALVEAREPDLAASAAWDTRVYAISPGSQRFLEQLGVWQRLDPARLAPITRMEVAGDDNGMIEFDAFDAGASELATIVEASALQRALWQVLDASDNLDKLIGAEPRGLEITSDAAHLALDNGMRLQARLVIGADGGESWVRQATNISSSTYRYAADGLVANFRVQRAHRGIARQWFRGDSVLAWLPLPDRHISIVWATPRAKELAALSGPQLAQAVEQGGSGDLGRLESVNKAAFFPLRLLKVATPIAQRIVLIGDAAHNVHPLAGQGVNLGFADAATLAAQLSQPAAKRDYGHAGLLRRYARARKADVIAVQAATHGLQKLFAAHHPAVRRLRNYGLDMTNSQGWLKDIFIRHAFG